MFRFRSSAIALVLAAGAISLGACATEKYVNEHVAVVDAKAQTAQGQIDAQQQALQTHDARLAQLDQTTRDAMQRAQDAGKQAEGKFVYTQVLSDDSVKFPAKSAKLSSEAQTRLLDLVNKLKADNKNVYVEIQGHTDSTETDRLGEARAQAVRAFMNQQGVALNRLPPSPTARRSRSATTRPAPGRAQNRCVVVVVLA